MSSDFDRESLISIFVAEATDGITTLWTALHPAGQMIPAKEMLQEQHVIGHKLKGAALIYGYSGLAKLGEALETILEQASAVSQSDWPRVVSALRELVKIFRSQLEIIGRGGQEDMSLIEECTRRCAELIPEPPASGHSDAAGPDAESLAPDYPMPKRCLTLRQRRKNTSRSWKDSCFGWRRLPRMPRASSICSARRTR